MNLATLKLLVTLGNLGAGGALTVAGGGLLLHQIREVKPLRPVVIPKEPVGKRTESKPPFDKFGHTWRIPWAPSQQPRPKDPGGPQPEAVQPSATVAQITAELEGAMTLLFTCAAAEPRWSRASIQLRSEPDKSKVIEVGETVRGAYKCTKIEHERVFFLVRNIEAPLGYGDANRPNVVKDTAAPPRSKTEEIIDRLRGTQEERPSGELDFVARATTPEAGVVVVTDEEWRWYETNGERLSREVAIGPHLDPKTRKVDGLELTEVPATSIVAKRGLAQGDVIKSVNGDPVTDMAQVPALAQKHRNAAVLTIVYVRRGVEQTVTIKRGGGGK